MKLQQTLTWIPVEERMPAKGQKVHIAVKSGQVFTGRLYACWSVDYGARPFPIDYVTHWAEPLLHPSKLAELTTEKAVEILTT